MRLVLLWFGSWKNSMSCYAPAWVKRDPRRFPRASDLDGTPQEILSPFSAANRDTDARAFAALLRHLREIDGARHTVLMVQVENEIGMIPTARDHSAEAERAFASAVPAELMGYLAAHADELAPELRASLARRPAARRAGTWSEVFGAGPAGEEIFMAWHFARYTEAVAAAGKKEYPLPMFVNAALIRPGHQPGQYPSGGPLPAPLRRLARRGAEHRLPGARHLLPELRRVGPALHAAGQPAVRPGGDAQPGGVGQRALRVRRARRDRLLAVRHRVDRRAGRRSTWRRSYDLVAQLEPLLVELQGKGRSAGLLSEGAGAAAAPAGAPR